MIYYNIWINKCTYKSSKRKAMNFQWKIRFSGVEQNREEQSRGQQIYYKYIYLSKYHTKSYLFPNCFVCFIIHGCDFILHLKGLTNKRIRVVVSAISNQSVSWAGEESSFEQFANIPHDFLQILELSIMLFNLIFREYFKLKATQIKVITLLHIKNL